MKFILLIYLLPLSISKQYELNWTDLDTRILPEWYDKSKIGIAVYWGVFSVPSFGTKGSAELFWSNWKSGSSDEKNFMAKNYRPGLTYQEFGPMFTAELFVPDQWATLFNDSGAKYIVLTSKHFDGYTLFPSNRSDSWNSVEIGPHRDLVSELSKSVRDKGMKFGVYYALDEWYHPMYAEDTKAIFSKRNYVDYKIWPDIKHLINNYKPSVLWVDGNGERDAIYWNSTGLLAWLYNDSPVKDEIVTNDKWDKKDAQKHGDFHIYEEKPKKLANHKWENRIQLDPKSSGYRRNIPPNQIITLDDLLLQLVSTVSYGGNALIIVGATKEGTIDIIYQKRLKALGNWLKINGEAIYESSPWLSQNDKTNTDVWYTCRKATYNAANPTAKPLQSDNVTAIYAIVLKWPVGGQVVLEPDVTARLLCNLYDVKLLGNDDDIEWSNKGGKAVILLPDKDKIMSKNAWTLKFTQRPVATRRQHLDKWAANWCERCKRRSRGGGLNRTPARNLRDLYEVL